MDMNAIWTMTRSDLRQRVRDKSVFIFGIIVPFALMWVFSLLFGGLSSDGSLSPVRVGVVASAGDQVVAGWRQAVTGISGVDVTLVDVARDQAAARLGDGNGDGDGDGDGLDAVVAFSEDFAASVQAGGTATVDITTAGDSGLSTQVVVSVTEGFVQRLAAAGRAAAAAGRSGLSPQDIAAVVDEVVASPPLVSAQVTEAGDEQLSLEGYLIAGQTALFMLFTVGFGVIGYLEERDVGTLARLVSMPLRPRSIVVAKTLVSFILGVLATTVLLVAGGAVFGVSFGAIAPIGVLVVATVAAATSLVLLVTKVAHTAEQAQLANSVLALGLGVLGGAFFPIGGPGLLTTLSDLTPPAAFIRGLGITHGGGGVTDLADPLAVMVGFLVVTVGLWAVLPQREMAT